MPRDRLSSHSHNLVLKQYALLLPTLEHLPVPLWHLRTVSSVQAYRLQPRSNSTQAAVGLVKD
jgi:hypothetical protein